VSTKQCDLWHLQPLSSPVLGVFEVKLDKDHHGLGITIAGYTDHSGLFSCFAFTAFSVFTLDFLAVGKILCTTLL